MKNIVILGSCLSEITVNALENMGQYKKIYHGMHLRTDIIRALLEDKTQNFLTKDSLESAIKFQQVDVDRNLHRIKFQSLEYLEALKENIQIADVIVIDLNYDLSRKGYSFINEGKSSIPYIINFIQSLPDGKNKDMEPDKVDCKDKGLLSANESIENLEEIITILKSINNKMEIFLINYPHSGFKIRNSMERVRSSETFKKLIDKKISKKVHVIPLLNIKKEYLSEKGAYYFEPKVYETFALYIKKILIEGNSSKEKESFYQIVFNYVKKFFKGRNVSENIFDVITE